jgi:hypothetical protein
MGLIKRLLGGSEDKVEFKQKLKEAQMDDKVARTVEERNMSANERDVLSRLKKKREEKIKIELDALRKEDSKEMWKSKHSVLDGGKKILANDRPILKEKNIFKDNPNLFSKEHAKKHKTDMGFFK